MKKILLSSLFVLLAATGFAGVIATATGNNPACNGSCNGSAIATAGGGTGPYGFTWTGPSGYTASGASISGLCAGTYIVTAIDSSDMSTGQYTLVLTDPSPVAVAVSGTITICEGAATVLTASATGGSGSFTYSWTPATGLSSSNISNPTVSLTTTTTYVVTATDASGCTGTTTVVVTVNPSPHISLSPSPSSCSACNGYINNGTTAASTYSWTGPGGFTATSANIYALCPGTYTLTAVNTFGCVASASTNIFMVPPMTLAPGVVSPAGCGACNGSASVTVTGGTAPYAYAWLPSGATVPEPMGLCAGAYTAQVTDATGCTQLVTVVVPSTPSITGISTTVTPASCGAGTGAVTIGAVTGGATPYTYSFDGGPFTSSTSYTGLAAGSYAVVVMDANSCSYTTSVVVNNTSGPTAAAIITASSGCAVSSGEISIGGITGGISPYLYSLNGSPYSSTTHYTALAAGNYSVMVQDSAGCVYTQLVTVSVSNAPVIALDHLSNINCGTPGSIDISVTGGTPAYTYSWSNGVTTEDNASVTAPGYCTVNVTDAAGCSASQSYYVAHNTSVYVSLSVTNINCGTPGSITAVPSGGTPPYTYLWNTTDTTATISGMAAGYYNCMVTDSAGCSNTGYTAIYSSCNNVIRGNIYNDLNMNCTRDAGENGLLYASITATGPAGTRYASTDVNGDYMILTPNMSNIVSVSLYYSSFMSPTCPATGSATVNFTTPGDTVSHVDFAYYTNPAYFNLSIHPGWSASNPGFTKQYWIYYNNNSPTPQNATLHFVYDSVLQFINATDGGVNDPATHTVEWNFTSVPPGPSYIGSQRPFIYFNVPSTLSPGALLHSYFEILPITGDANPSDNTLTSVEPVTGCHDPNSMLVNPAGTGPGGDIYQSDSILTYTVHFQNNGNDTAHFVIVKDTLSGFLDPVTLLPGGSDHTYSYSLSGDGIAEFRFDNIMLPDSTTDEAGSSGYVTYMIHVKQGTPVGSVINNNASIYFDYNLPVVTNTTVNTIVDMATGIDAVYGTGAVSVYPNPFTDNTTFVIRSGRPEESYSFELRDVLGKKVKELGGISGKQFSISRSGLQDGIYFYRISTKDKIVGIGKLIIR